jgi:hypothetical protein
LERASKRRAENEDVDRFEREHIDFHNKRRQAFLRLAQQDPTRCHVIDAAQTEDEISYDIWQIVLTELIKPMESANDSSGVESQKGQEQEDGQKEAASPDRSGEDRQGENKHHENA